jgi:CHASE2 domain-containing sensor protein
MPAEPFSKTLARQLLLALPVFLAYWLLAGLLGSFLDHRLAVAAVAVPLGVACWVLWRLLARDRGVLLGGRFLLFLLAYCLLFSVLAGSDVLTWKRTLVGYEDRVPRNWLGRFLPPRLADWHCLVAPEAQPASDLLVVTLPALSARPLGEVRRDFAALIHQAVERGAKGIALDFYLEGTSPTVDPLLCRQVEAAVAAGVPVFVGYRYEERQGLVVPRPPAPTLTPCLPEERRGSLSGYAEVDGRVRMVPLFLGGNDQRPSLSLQVARALLHGEPPRPAGDLVQFLRPRGGLPPFAGLPRGDDLALFQQNFVIVGTAAPSDRVDTPFGPLQGVEVLAWAAQALRTRVFIRPLPAVWTFPATFALCYLLAATLARRGGWRRLVGLAAVLSLAVVVVAALAMRFALVWVDVSYPLVAMWGLVGLLGVAGGALRLRLPVRGEPAAVAAAAGEVTPVPTPGFDVFLSHNGKDKPAVRELAAALRARGLRPWLDEEELVPGRPWQEALEAIITRASTAAVLTGADGLGPWEEMEMRACLSQFVERKKPVIPVLLPGSPARPNLPLFLTQFTWVDLRDGFTDSGLDRLQWAITGKKPAVR